VFNLGVSIQLLAPNLLYMSKLIEEFKKYRDKWGMNQLTSTNGEGDVTQNGELFTVEYLICLIADQNTPEEEKKAEIERIRKVFDTLEVVPGTSVRFPGSPEGGSMDNQVARAMFSHLFEENGYMKRQYEHPTKFPFIGVDWRDKPTKTALAFGWAFVLAGFKAPKWFWNNTLPGWFTYTDWYGRSPGFMARLKWMATGKLGLWGKFIIWISQMIGCFKKPEDLDAWKLTYIEWYWLAKKGWLWKQSYKLWCWAAKKKLGEGGMKVAYYNYYQDKTHPISKYSPRFFEV
jgi:hypothetical protein